MLARLHILEGLLIAYLNIDEVIEIIRTEDEPGKVMVERFNITETQAEAILELKLRHLAKLEEFKLRAEQNELAEERDKLELILGSERRLNTLLKKELLADAEKYGDDRRTPLVERATAVALTEKELIPSETGHRHPLRQGVGARRQGPRRGCGGALLQGGDSYLAHACGRSNQQAVFLSTLGRTYALESHTLPSARSQGEPLTGRFALGAGEEVRHLVMGNEGEPYLIASDAGYGFVCTYDDLIGKNKNGKALLTVPEGGQVMAPQKIGSPENRSLHGHLQRRAHAAVPAQYLAGTRQGQGQQAHQHSVGSREGARGVCGDGRRHPAGPVGHPVCRQAQAHS